MICFWNFQKHNELQIGLLTHCLWFRHSAKDGAWGSAHGCEASLLWLEHGGDIMAARFHNKMSKCPCIEASSCDAECAVEENSSSHNLDCLQRHDLWMFPFQHLMLSVDVQVSQELKVWCKNLETLSKLQSSVGTYNMCIRHVLPSEKRQFCIYGCVLDLTFAQKLLNSVHVLEEHSACISTTLLWKSLTMGTHVSTWHKTEEDMNLNVLRMSYLYCS